MALLRFEVDQFRCLERVEIALDPRYNLFVGKNASGKTSLLEALFFLGRGRSFRTRRLDRLVRQGHDAFRLIGRVSVEGRATVIGIGGSRSATEIRIGGAPAQSAAELATHFPPQIIDPEVHKLLEEGPHRRRRFLDWGVFHVEHHFMETWQRYHRALRQRTAALRLPNGSAAVRVFEPELLASGSQLSVMRLKYIENLSPVVADLGLRLLGLPVSVVLNSGWPADEDFAEALTRSRDRDLRLGVTHVGPHRADISVRVAGLAAKERISRGQQKLLAAALTLAQLALQEGQQPGRSVLLLDDPAAELDGDSLARLLAVVRELPVQLFVTALRPDLPGLGEPGALFHVEQGTIRRG
jgi:DNA replication and repair protein RecF